MPKDSLKDIKVPGPLEGDLDKASKHDYEDVMPKDSLKDIKVPGGE